MKYFLIAGEASGDLHASTLISGLKNEDPEADFEFAGGDLMAEAAGKSPLSHFRDMNFMGIVEVIKNLGTLGKIFRKTKAAIMAYDPDVLILVDYAGFNLRMAKFASRSGIRVCYYISPKVWAWRKSRVRTMKKHINHLFVIFPFEVEFFRNQGMEVEYFGNPLIDRVESFKKEKEERKSFRIANRLDNRPVIALLAGSRRQEIHACLPEMIRASRYFSEHQFVVAGAPSIDRKVYEELLSGTEVKIVYNNTYSLLENAYAAVVTSGTATLEAALFDVPQVVVYKTGMITYAIGRALVKVRFISLVNLILGKELVKELLQKDLVARIRKELSNLLQNDQYRRKMRDGYARVRELSGEPGASGRVAHRIVELLR